MFWARRTSSSRGISGYALMARRYWSSEPSSYDDFLLPVEAIRTAKGSGRAGVVRGCVGRGGGGGGSVGRSFGLLDPLTQPRPADVREPCEGVYRVRSVAVIDHER